MPHETTRGNGLYTKSRRYAAPTRRLPQDTMPIEAAVSDKNRGFSFNDLGRMGVALRLPVSTFLLGLGTTGSQIVHHIVQLAIRELGRLPPSLDFFLIDAAAAPMGVSSNQFFQMAVDGCGTDPKVGDVEFCRHYRHLRSVMMSLVLGLFSACGELTPPLGARAAMNFWLFAGQGGTSGGSMHRAITLLHDVAQERRIQDPRIHVALIGPEISLRDITRSITREQQQVVRDTFAGNLAKLSLDYKESLIRTETRPDGTTFERMTSHRIHALGCNDQSNGVAEFATVADFVRSMAHIHFLRIMTQSGIDLMDQACNLDRLNVTGRRDH